MSNELNVAKNAATGELSDLGRFTGRYPIAKTLSMRLIPQWETEANYDRMHLMEQDKERAANAGALKQIADRVHRWYIDDSLQGLTLDGLTLYAELYAKKDKTKEEREALDTVAAQLRKQISERMTKRDMFDMLRGDKFVKEILPKFCSTDEELSIVNSFVGFTTYLTNYFLVRKSMYGAEGNSGQISYRLIDENLPMFLSNAEAWEKILAAVDQSTIDYLNEHYSDLWKGRTPEDIFSDVKFFSMTLTQTGIEKYNRMIGGFVTEDGTHIKGVNQLVSEFKHQHKTIALPKLKQLYKQMLSETTSASYTPVKFGDSEELRLAVHHYIDGPGETSEMSGLKAIEKATALMSALKSYEMSGIVVGVNKSRKEITDFAHMFYGKFQCVDRGLQAEYDTGAIDKLNANIQKTPYKEENLRKRYEAKRDEFVKSKVTMSLDEIDYYARLGYREAVLKTMPERIADKFVSLQNAVLATYAVVKPLLDNPYPEDQKMYANDEECAAMRAFLDSIKDFQRTMKLFLGTDNGNTDAVFYGEFMPLYERIDEISRLYDRGRNFLTQTKPYSRDKIKVTFNIPQFLNGWGCKNYERGKPILMEKDGLYYLGIVYGNLTAAEKAALDNVQQGDDSATRYVYYHQKPDNKGIVKLFLISRNATATSPVKYAPAVEAYDLPIDKVLPIYTAGKFKTDYYKKNPERYPEFREALATMIDYFKMGLQRHVDFKPFTFHWKPTEEYNNIGEFYHDCETSCYRLEPKQINWDAMREMVRDGKVFLYQIYNQDFSPNAKGKPNLFTMYFKALFSEENRKALVYALNGGAEMFCREASISPKDMIVHPANKPIKNKNPNSEREWVTYPYDIIKDRRYTERQFFLHLATTMNFRAPAAAMLNDDVRQLIHDREENYVIGINRGERNLIYIVVIDSKGNIVEQRSLNTIEYNDKNTTARVDYKSVLSGREEERKAERRSWSSVTAIKDLKEGYLSQVIYEIMKLIRKYHAPVIAIENLDSKIKMRERVIERSVYQKFENSLIEKLNYLVFKDIDQSDVGGVMNALQLVNKSGTVENANRMRQNGIIFSIPAWMTSEIDPVTGFINRLYPYYTNMEDARAFFSRFDSMRFNADKGWFEFEINYDNFSAGAACFRKKWTITTRGSRTKEFRNPEKNNKWDYQVVDLTAALSKLLTEAGIDFSHGRDFLDDILRQTNAQFFRGLTDVMKLVVQLRNVNTETNTVNIVSPVQDDRGIFFSTEAYHGTTAKCPVDVDANGAYNIARKALMIVNNLKAYKTEEDLHDAKIGIMNDDWMKFVQG